MWITRPLKRASNQNCRSSSVRWIPGGPEAAAIAMLGEAIVHGEDIRRPLGIRRAYPNDTLTRLATYYQGSDLVVQAKGRLGGLRLESTDGPFAAGTGEIVRGTTLALVMTMTGRTAYLDELDGPGVDAMRERV